MISAKELRIGNLVKDKAGNIWSVYRGYGISIEIFDDGYYLSLRDLEDDLSDPIQIKNLHHLQNLLMDLYGHDIKIDKLYGDTGE